MRQRSDTEPALMHYPRVFTTCAQGLLFVDRLQGFTGEDVVNLLLSDEVAKYVGPAYMAVRTRHSAPRYYGGTEGDATESTSYAVLVTTDASQHAIAEAPPGKGEFIYFRVGDAVLAAPLGNIVDCCGMLTKALGCERCPTRGAECLWLNLPEQVQVLRRLPSTNEVLPILRHEVTAWTGALKDERSDYRRQLAAVTDTDIDKLKPWRSTVGGFLYIPEGATHRDPLYPGNGRRRYAFSTPRDHHFNDLEDNHARLIERSRAASKTRNFIHQECHQCYFGSKYGACDKWRARNCGHGAWTEQRLIDYTLESVRHRLLETKSTFTLPQLWTIANICGERFSQKDERTGRIAEFVVQRVGESPGNGTSPWRPCVFVSRTARDARRELPALQFFSLKSLRRFLPDVLQQRLDQVPTLVKENHKQLALWLQLAVTSHGKSYTFLFSTKDSCGYSWAQPRVGTVQMHFSGVTVELWLAKFERDHSFSSFQKVLDHHERLPYFDITATETQPVEGRALTGNVR